MARTRPEFDRLVAAGARRRSRGGEQPRRSPAPADAGVVARGCFTRDRRGVKGAEKLEIIWLRDGAALAASLDASNVLNGPNVFGYVLSHPLPRLPAASQKPLFVRSVTKASLRAFY